MLNSSLRVQGVLTPEGQQTDRTDVPDGTVLSVMPCNLVFVQYVENGREVAGLALMGMDGTVYLDPDGSIYAQKLRRVTDRFKKSFDSVLQRVESKLMPTEPSPSIEGDISAVAASMAKGE